MVAPIEEFLREDIGSDLIALFPFVAIDINQIIEAYERESAEAESRTD